MPGIHQKVEIKDCKKCKKDGSQGLKEGHNLSKKLLHLWSLGKSSAAGLQELAHASTSDGLQSQEIMELSGLGAFGSYPNKCHRDLLRLLKTNLKKIQVWRLERKPHLLHTGASPRLQRRKSQNNGYMPYGLATCIGVATF